MKCVFRSDGAKWSWDKVTDLVPANGVDILDFLHACEQVSDICKEPHREGSEAYRQRLERWRLMLLGGGVETFLAEVRQILEVEGRGTKKADFPQGGIDYFAHNRERMRYDQHRVQNLPIGSGTIESWCKKVIARLMKREGMT